MRSGIESINAGSALWYAGLPGWDSAGLPEEEPEEPYIHHFPDGNASIARQLVRRMIPAVAPGRSMKSLVSAKFDYSKLDQEETPVRIRLNSTVVNVRRDEATGSDEIVVITYVSQGKTYRLRAAGCILACNDSASFCLSGISGHRYGIMLLLQAKIQPAARSLYVLPCKT